MRILGIDPGLASAGYGIIDYQKQSLKLIDFGSIKTPAQDPIPMRLKHIYSEFQLLAKKYNPDVISMERLFFARNTKTAMMVAQAIGVIMVSFAEYEIPIEEYTPLQIKQSMVNIKASKNQVQRMVKEILGLKQIPKPNHAADALAAAICHVFRSRYTPKEVKR